MAQCENTQSNVNTEFVESEISNSLSHVKTQKDVSIGAVKIYITVIFAFFAYISFVQTKVLNIATPTPDDLYFQFTIFGILLTSFIFMLGWVLLDFITNSIFTSIIHYKHVSHMRALKAEVLGDSFTKRCIVPISAKQISLKRSRHLPIIFSVFNFLILCANYYFFSLSTSSDMAATYTMFIMGAFALYYPNVCAKYYEEILIAQRVSPGKDEQNIRKIVRKRINANKNETTHKRIFLVFKFFAGAFLLTMFGNLYYHHVMGGYVPTVSLYFEVVILFLIAAFRYLVAQVRVQKTICIKPLRTI